MLVIKTIKQKVIKPIIFIAIFALGIPFAAPFIEDRSFERVTVATTAEELRNKTATIESQIQDNEEVLINLESKIDSLENKLVGLRTEVAIAQQKIDLTAAQIEQLTVKLAETEAELARQKEVLAENLRTLYIEGDVSTMQLIFAAENFNEFFEEQQYLESLKASVQDSTERVAVLKDEITAEKLRQEQLQVTQQENRDVLTARKAEQQSILDQTKGEEAAYQQVVEGLRADLIAAQEELEELLAAIAASQFVSLGKVNAGDTIGYVGSTGFSTGPHLHFATYSGGTFVDPYAGGGSINYGLIWPLPTVGTEAITQLFGCIAPYDWYLTKCANGNSLHAGLDVSAWYGEPVVAAGAGDIVYRGWLGGYGNVVIIDHGDVQTYYAHLNE